MAPLTSNYLYLCKYILHYSTVWDSLYTHTCIFPQYLILPIPFQTLTFLRQKWQLEGNTKQLNKLQKRLTTLCPELSQQWKKRGIIIMNSTFMPMAQEMFNYLCEQAEELDNPIFIDPYM